MSALLEAVAVKELDVPLLQGASSKGNKSKKGNQQGPSNSNSIKHPFTFGGTAKTIDARSDPVKTDDDADDAADTEGMEMDLYNTPRYNLKFDANVYTDTNTLKNSFFQAYITLVLDQGLNKTTGMRLVADALNKDPLWARFRPLTDKKMNSAYGRLISKQLAAEVNSGSLSVSVDEQAADVPAFLKLGMHILSKDPARNRANAKRKQQLAANAMTLAALKESPKGSREEDDDDEDTVADPLHSAPHQPAPVRILLQSAPTSPAPAAFTGNQSESALSLFLLADEQMNGEQPAKHKALTSFSETTAVDAAESSHTADSMDAKRIKTVRLTGAELASKLADDPQRDAIADQLALKGICTIQGLLTAASMSQAAFEAVQQAFTLSKPAARILKPVGDALLATLCTGMVQVGSLERELGLSKGDAMDLYEFLREHVQ